MVVPLWHQTVTGRSSVVLLLLLGAALTYLALRELRKRRLLKSQLKYEVEDMRQ